MPRSKTLKLFLMDGEPSGRIKCSLANWTGIAYKIPRTSLDKCKDVDILKQSGVYFLFGTNKDDDAVVYIGQAGVPACFGPYERYDRQREKRPLEYGCGL